MINKLSLTIITDNKSSRSDLKSEHGFSLWIEADEKNILFDTGQSGIFLENAQTLDIDLKKMDLLVLSHGHYDHTGGVAETLTRHPRIPVYCHPGIFIPRYSRKPDGEIAPIGLSRRSADTLWKKLDSLKWTNTPVFISEDIGITGPIPRECPFEDTGGAFFLDPGALVSDPINDDLAIWFRTAKGILVVTGCCHSGIINTLSCISELTGNAPLHSIIGGFHLLNSTKERIDATFDYLTTKNPDRIIPCHCTGDHVIEHLKKRFRETCIPGEVGTRILLT